MTINVHVHRPPAIILNETPEEFHISTGTISEDLNQIYCGRSLDMNIKKGQVKNLNYSGLNEAKYINQLFGIVL